jgi:hypothetical protein
MKILKFKNAEMHQIISMQIKVQILNLQNSIFFYEINTHMISLKEFNWDLKELWTKCVQNQVHSGHKDLNCGLSSSNLAMWSPNVIMVGNIGFKFM